MYEFLSGKTIVLYTEVIYGNGDFFATKKLIQAIEKEAKGVTIHWVISAPKSRKDVAIKKEQAQKEFSNHVHITQRDWKEGLKVNHIAHCDLVLLYPTVHYLKLHDYTLLKAFGVPIIQKHEYDGMLVNYRPPYKSELASVNTGFDGLGLNLEDFNQIDARSIVDNLLPAPYQLVPEQQLFFSYSSTDISSQINQASLVNYLNIALEISDTKCSVDVVANAGTQFLTTEVSTIAWSQGFSEICIITKNKEDQYQVQVKKNPADHVAPRRLRLIDVFPLTNTQMRALMSVAHPFIHTTGDQSFAETLSVASLKKSVFPFYQTMHWKELMVHNWQQLSCAYLGKKSNYVKLQEMAALKKDFSVDAFVMLWRDKEKEILADSQVFFEKIQERNLKYNGLVFLDFVFYIIKNFPNNEFNNYCQLVAQLIVKVKDTTTIQKVLASFATIPDSYERKTLMLALTEFIRLNPVSLSAEQLLEIILQLRAIKTVDQFYAGATARKSLGLIPLSVRDQYVLQILPELKKISATTYSMVVKDIKEAKYIARQKSGDWLHKIIERNLIWDEASGRREHHNSILLCVHIFPDGFGDLAKFIDVYHITKRAMPNTRIQSLVYCADSMRPIVLHLLRAADVDMHQLYLCAFNPVEQVIVGYANTSVISKAADAIIRKKHHEAGFYDHRDHALYISVATPFPAINREFRNYGRSTCPYLDMGEVNFVSYADVDRQSADPNHYLVSMGLDDESVGLQITAPSVHGTPDSIIANLGPELRRKLFDDKQYTNDSVLFPCYVKNDQGILSIHYLLALMSTYYKDKQSAIMWMTAITFELDNKLIQDKLRSAGFKQVTYFNPEGVCKAEVIPNATGTRELRIVTGVISNKDFDLLYQLAGITSGFTGCSGQNSFEKSMSFNCLPSFCAPGWQIPIICQTQQIVATIFDHHSEEYHVLNKYLDLLSHVSNASRYMKELIDTDLLKPFAKLFSQSTYSQISEMIENITEGKITRQMIEQYYPVLLNGDPVTIVDDFFARTDVTSLRAAWRKVCDYCRQHRNLTTWLTEKLHELLPDVSKLVAVTDSKADKSIAAVLNSPHITITADSHPHTHRIFTEILERVDNRPQKYPIKFVVANCNSVLIDVVSGLDHPTIAISIHALRHLSINEMRFAMRVCLSLMTNYPIENNDLRYRDLNQDEIIKYVKDDMEFGIAYCRKLIAFIKDAQIKVKISDYKTQHYYDLGYIADFHADLIKMIEMQMAARNKNVLQASLFKTPEVVLPETVTVEVDKQVAVWHEQEQERLMSMNTIQALKSLLEEVPSLRIKTDAELTYPTNECRLFLLTFEQLRVDPNNKKQVKLITQILDAAHTNRVSIFTYLYMNACSKLFNGKLRPLSLYKHLVDDLHTFIYSKDQATAEAQAKLIDDKLNGNEYVGMFMNSVKSDMLYRGDKDRDSTPVDTYPFSNIGARIEWCNEVDVIPCSSLSTFTRWATSGQSPHTAAILFRLGHVNIKELWPHLPQNLISRALFSDAKFFGELPYDYVDNKIGYGNVAPKLNGIYDYFIQYLHCRTYTPMQHPINAINLETFIISNQGALAFSRYSPHVCKELTRAMEEFLKRDRGAAERFIWRFYCDKKFPAGIRKLVKFRKVNGLGIYDKLDETLGEERNGEKFHPYLEFIIDHGGDYLPIADVLTVLGKSFSVCYAHWPLRYFFRMLKLNADRFSDVNAAVSALRDLNLSLSSYEPRSYVASAISNTFKHAAENIRDIQLFSEDFYNFYKEVGKEGARSDLATVLFKRQDIIEQVLDPGRIEITCVRLVKIYVSFDARLVWPNETIRDAFSKIVLDAIKSEQDVLKRMKSLELLLFKNPPISDTGLIKEAIEMYACLTTETLGEDDNSFVYYRKAAIAYARIFKNTPRLYTKDLIELITTRTFAQPQLLEYIAKTFAEDVTVGSLMEEKSQTYLVKIARKLAKENSAMETVKFVTYDITRQSLLTYVRHLNDEARRALGGREGYDRITDEQASIYASAFYHNFWNQSIEARAAIINNLLMNSKHLMTDAGALASYQCALEYIINELFPNRDKESKICIALLHSYLKVSNEHVRPYLLSAILTANKMSSGKRRSVESTLPKIAEALGAAGVKAGQAGHSFPHTPEHLREGLAYLKSRARLPFRWELWKLIKDAVPGTFIEDMHSIRSLLGGASFYIAVEVRMKNDTSKVVRLLRPNAQEESTYGFEHLHQTLASCDDPLVAGISDDVGSIIREAKKGAQLEINHVCAERQYVLAKAIYEHARIRLRLDESVYHVSIEPVHLYHCGSNFQIISKADGIEFNSLKIIPAHRKVCEAAAMAVYMIELENMLSGRPCDFDRHGAQARVQWEERAPNEFCVRVTNYDFGEVLPDLPTEAQLYHCQQFIDLLASNIFSMRNLIAGFFGSLNVGNIATQITQQMLMYLRINEQSSSEHDLLRLRGLFKGLLALNDYFEMIPKNKMFMLELNALFMKYANATSLAARILGWYVGRPSLPSIVLPEANPNYQGSQLLAALPQGENNNNLDAESELKKLKVDDEYSVSDSLLEESEPTPKKRSCGGWW